MKVCVISDTHIHPFTSFATGIGANNSRVQTSLDALDQVYKFCLANKIKHLIHAGDLFHARDHQRYPVFNAVADKLVEMSKDLFITLIIGNHDIVDRAGTTSAHALNNIIGVEVITKPTISSLGILFIPYTTDHTMLRAELSKLLGENGKAESDLCVIGHLDMCGAEIGSAMHVVTDGLPNNSFLGFKKVLLGHYHKCQQVAPNTYYIGALTPVDFGDKGQEGRFCTLDTDTGEVQWLTVNCPMFVEWNIEHSANASSFQGNYVRVIGEQSEDALLFLKGAKAFEFVPKPKEQVSVERITNIESMNWAELIARYVSIKKPKNLNKDQLIKLGLELLQ